MELQDNVLFPIIRYWANRYYYQFRNLINDPDELFNIVYLGKIKNAKTPAHAATCAKQDILDHLRKELRRNRYCACVDFCELEIACPESETDQSLFLSDLDKIMSSVELTFRERFIIYQYYYQAHTMQEIADLIGLSKSNISRIHDQTLQKLKKIGEQNELFCRSR